MKTLLREEVPNGNLVLVNPMLKGMIEISLDYLKTKEIRTP